MDGGHAVGMLLVLELWVILLVEEGVRCCITLVEWRAFLALVAVAGFSSFVVATKETQRNSWGPHDAVHM